MRTDSSEHGQTDDVTEVTETWENEVGEDSTSSPVASANDDAKLDAEFEALARVRNNPWTLQHMMWLVALIAIVFWLCITLGWVLLFVIVAMGFAMLVGLGFILARIRVTRQDALLRILAIAAERGVPFSTAVTAFADQFRGRSRHRAVKLIDSLEGGNLIPDALEQTPKALSRDAVLMAWIGQSTGMLPQALRLAGTFRSAQLSLWMATASRLSYLLGMIIIMQGIVGFLLYNIMPRLESIFRDFDARLPGATMLVIEFSRKIADYAAISALIGTAEMILILYIPFSFGGWMNYKVPIFDRMLTRRHTALILRALSLVIESKKPIAMGLSTLSNHYPTKWVRRRLIRVETNVRLGADWINALWRAGLIRRTDAEVLGSAASVGNLPWALRELAETSERRQIVRIRSLLQTLFPLVVIMIGLAVAVLALGYFLPIVKLIGKLSDQ